MQPPAPPTRADTAFADTWDLVRIGLFRQRAVRDLVDDLARQSSKSAPNAQLVYWQGVQRAAELLAVGQFTATELNRIARQIAESGPDPSVIWSFYQQACGGPPGWPYGLAAERARRPSSNTIRRAILVTAARIDQRSYGAAVAKVAADEHVAPATVRQSLSRVTGFLARGS